jgi:hypothetical protein
VAGRPTRSEDRPAIARITDKRWRELDQKLDSYARGGPRRRPSSSSSRAVAGPTEKPKCLVTGRIAPFHQVMESCRSGLMIRRSAGFARVGVTS